MLKLFGKAMAGACRIFGYRCGRGLIVSVDLSEVIITSAGERAIVFSMVIRVFVGKSFCFQYRGI